MAQAPDFSTLKTFGTMGKEVRPLKGDSEAELFRHDGKGCLTHMWFGGGWKDCDRTRIRVYVDGETKPSIDMELYLGHGIGFGDDFSPWGTARDRQDRHGHERLQHVPHSLRHEHSRHGQRSPTHPTHRNSGGSFAAPRTCR